jgi:hypothetical protein
MPGYDRTGPEGRGPMTGGGFGRCGSGFRAGPADGGPGLGYGAGRGYGRGRGRRGCRRFAGSGTGVFSGFRRDSKARLQGYAEDLESELSQVRDRLAQLARGNADRDD